MKYSLDEFEKYDKVKSKVLKYVLYKKRTEQEIRQKFFKEIDENVLEEIIEDLKENSYINDYSYIERSIDEFVNLKTLSIKEIRYKLLSKGIDNRLIEDYISKNIDNLSEYELKSAYKTINKKRTTMDDDEIKVYLLKKGYKEETIKEAFCNN